MSEEYTFSTKGIEDLLDKVHPMDNFRDLRVRMAIEAIKQNNAKMLLCALCETKYCELCNINNDFLTNKTCNKP